VLYVAHFSLVSRALKQFGVRECDVMDLAQKVFLTAYLKLPDFEGRSLLSTWLWGICRRVARSHRRSAVMRREVAIDPMAVESCLLPSDNVPAGEACMASANAVEYVLGKLTPLQRAAFVLAEADDLDGRQIAVLLDVPLGTVRSRLRKARVRIQREVRRLSAEQDFAGRP